MHPFAKIEPIFCKSEPIFKSKVNLLGFCILFIDYSQNEKQTPWESAFCFVLLKFLS